MLQQRLKKLTHQPSKLDMRQRHRVLQSIEGWYSVPTMFDQSVAALHDEYLQSGSALKFTRWLVRIKKLDNDFVTDVGKKTYATSVKVSCNLNDLIRLGDTTHYKSCMRNSLGMGRQQLLYLSDPDIALAYVPDPAGKYAWRTLLRLAYSPAGVLSLVAYRVYGNGPTEAIFKTLEAKTGMSIYSALDIKNRDSDCEKQQFVSPTVHNNLVVCFPVWTDHLVGVTQQKRISITVADAKATGPVA